jgi:hypothetical protein
MNKPIFVVGSPRSGTSILTWCLGQHSNILAQEESDRLGRFTLDLQAAYQTGTHRAERSQLGSLGVPTGTVCDLARPTEIWMDVNSRTKLSKFTASGFLGYIRDYNPETRYTACAADDNGFSRESLPVEALEPTTGDK